MAGEELPDFVLGRRIEQLVVAAPDLSALLVGEDRRIGVVADIGRDEIGQSILICRRQRGPGFVHGDVETGVHGERIAARSGGGKPFAFRCKVGHCRINTVKFATKRGGWLLPGRGRGSARRRATWLFTEWAMI